jgi:hypothetical protein
MCKGHPHCWSLSNNDRSALQFFVLESVIIGSWLGSPTKTTIFGLYLNGIKVE